MKRSKFDSSTRRIENLLCLVYSVIFFFGVLSNSNIQKKKNCLRLFVDFLVLFFALNKNNNCLPGTASRKTPREQIKVFEIIVTSIFFFPTLLSFSKRQVSFSEPCLTLSQTSPGFYTSAVQVFWKHWEKEKLLIRSNFSFSHCVFYLFGELSDIFDKFEIVVCRLFQFGRV